MKKTYQDSSAASEYSRFSASIDGQMQQELIKKAIQNFLPPNPKLSVFDAGCGNGWLTQELAKQYENVQAVDFSEDLIKEAKKNWPNLNFQAADLSFQLPFEKDSFDIITLNLVIHNIENQIQAFKNLAGLLKPGGKILMTVVNSYYGYPAAVWKRSWWQKLLGFKPRLKLQSYNRLLERERNYVWGKNIPVRFSPLPEQINNALAAGLTLEYISDLKTESDSKKFDFCYRLYRWPLITLMVFRK